ncbi:MAG: hypothetical protein ACI8Y4_000645 [Candidatus Poriferisodalaceae bacterium]|jgi:uncharacterized protein (TIGR00369 family)
MSGASEDSASTEDPATTEDLLARVIERSQSNNYWRTLGVEVQAAEAGYVRLRIPVRPELCNADGAPMHGGVICALVDMAVGGALSTMASGGAGGTGQATTDLNVSFLGGIREGGLVAEGRILKAGRRLAFGEAELRDDNGRWVAKGRVTYMILAPT